ncbi:neutral zinc metallopeptidase [Brevundimonas sp. NIBR10]|uniref:neutral zinc metallopeptidase n=1 Tax=Brevundimonas sp. NIBR10 TaxID=3015997 RepID=UPI0022F1DB74|nr:neutral zinc metallopeptidase [Brevundimonas sp. NIBR10]
MTYPDWCFGIPMFSHLGLILLTLSQSANANGGPEIRKTIYEAMVRSTTVEWTSAFEGKRSLYAPPRIVFLETPVGHPARGAGYSADVGVVLDLGDLNAVAQGLGDDGPSMAALLVAHEVGHHVQHLMGDDPEVRGPRRELQADCLAGWWIAAAGRRAQADHRAPAYPAIDLDLRLAQTLDMLEAVQTRSAPGAPVDRTSHGTTAARVAAVTRGMAVSEPWTCLWATNP